MARVEHRPTIFVPSWATWLISLGALAVCASFVMSGLGRTTPHLKPLELFVVVAMSSAALGVSLLGLTSHMGRLYLSQLAKVYGLPLLFSLIAVAFAIRGLAL
jgi:hypothetical protein